MKKQYEMVECADGFTMSVQASNRNYSNPRDDVGPYTEVEVGFPSSYDIHLHDFAENPDKPTETVYGWVPADIIIMCIASHGGMVAGELPPLVKTEFVSIE